MCFNVLISLDLVIMLLSTFQYEKYNISQTHSRYRKIDYIINISNPLFYFQILFLHNYLSYRNNYPNSKQNFHDRNNGSFFSLKKDLEIQDIGQKIVQGKSLIIKKVNDLNLFWYMDS